MKVPVTGATPTYAHEGDAGADLRSTQSITLRPGERRLIGTGVRCKLPEGTVGLLCTRSGLAYKAGVQVLNAPGIIDNGYTGEIKVNLYNSSKRDHIIFKGDRIAQLVITPFVTAEFETVTEEDFDTITTERGAGGHGSSGT